MHVNRRQLTQTSLAALVAACAGERSSGGDIILHGGPIYTGVAARPRTEAVRIRGQRILFAGALSDARSGAAGARMIDLRGAAAFPGFVDAHVHLGGVGLQAMMLNLVGTPSIAALRQSLADYARAHPQGPIIGRGWIETHWPEGRFPNRGDLDGVVAGRPVYLQRIDGHAGVTNSAGLALAGITNSTPDPQGGRIERDASGAATGMLIDNAKSLIETRLPSPTREMRREALRQATRLYASRGWTGGCNMSTSGEETAQFVELAAQNDLPIRTDIYLVPEDSDPVLQRGPYQDASGLVRVRGVKLYMDGALGSRGAALLAPYSDLPGSTGLLVTPDNVLRDFMRRARVANAQVATHAIGDRGNRIALDDYQATFADNLPALRAARWRIEHAQVLSPQDLPRFAQLGVIASMQASHAISDLYFAPARLGPDRLGGAYAWNSLLRSGAVIASGTDAPVEKGDPLIEFYAAAYRHDLEGHAGPDWHLEETVTREQALRDITWGSAYSAFAERDRGTLEVGKFADISVFSIDLMEAPFAHIPTAHAVLTMVGGRIVHQAI
ncbi:MAG: amidohydrolase [Proteobacteria bacterium]|nr:amidohydrolase [Pseudomonadota bacterium]